MVLHVRGSFNGIHKIVFEDVAYLRLSRTQEIAEQIFGRLKYVTVSRIDWCVDLLGVSLWDLAPFASISRVIRYKIFHSRTGTTFYPHQSHTRTVLLYDRLQKLRMGDTPFAKHFTESDQLTRIEVQLRGTGVTHRQFRDIRKFSDDDLLADLKFLKPRPVPEYVSPITRFAIEYVRELMKTVGIQAVAKRFPSNEFAHFRERYLESAPAESLNVNERLKKSIRDWLEDRIRFPRTRFGGHGPLADDVSLVIAEVR